MADDGQVTRSDVLPVTVAEFDRLLLADERTVVAMAAARVLPTALVFQFLIRLKDNDGGTNPNLAFDLPHLLRPGDLRLGVRAQTASGVMDVPVHVAGGGGGDGSFEFKMWFELPDGATALQLWSEWPERDLPERGTDLDPDLIRQAAARCAPLW
ncbi:hypothetical protein [Dactylosporangium sp. NPDC048998]|uniref:hypothetical protein n=1 Tax=Dactylosporangium sp. NPDC048998 TaxID=3363976 RepID=UPI003716CC1B